jgi:hypothetical protein
MITLNFEEAYDLIIGGNLQIIEIQPRLLILHGVTTPAGSFRICYKNSTRQKCDCIRVPFENEQEKEKILKTFKKEDNSKNTIAFVIISTLIELTILAGVYFNEYYKFRSYREFRDKLEKDPNYQKFLLYDEILHVIYTEDTKMNQKLPSNKAIIDMCKVNDMVVLNKDIMDFLKVISNLGIIKVSGSAKYINKQRDLAFDILKNHFGVE